MPHVLPLAALDPSKRGSGVMNLASREINGTERQPESLSLREATQPRQVALWGQEARCLGEGGAKRRVRG